MCCPRACHHPAPRSRRASFLLNSLRVDARRNSFSLRAGRRSNSHRAIMALPSSRIILANLLGADPRSSEGSVAASLAGSLQPHASPTKHKMRPRGTARRGERGGGSKKTLHPVETERQFIAWACTPLLFFFCFARSSQHTGTAARHPKWRSVYLSLPVRVFAM